MYFENICDGTEDKQNNATIQFVRIAFFYKAFNFIWLQSTHFNHCYHKFNDLTL